MKNRPLFSCVVPVKGARPYFDAAVDSLRGQGAGGDLEIIIQDADLEPDGGQSDALNRGFARARGEWFFWLNADDLLLPGALAAVGAKLDGERWIAGNELYIDRDGRTIGASAGPGWHDWLFRHSIPHVNGPSAFFRRELFERVGGFDTSLGICMDWDLWIRFMLAGARYRRIDRFLWALRNWEGSKTQRELTAEEWRVHDAEKARMFAKNGFTVTRAGTMKLKAWKFLSGCYLREMLGRRGGAAGHA